jgi:hypothetical protein
MRRSPRRVGAESPRPKRALGIVAIVILAGLIAGYDFAGMRRLRADPVIGVDYLPVVQYVAERKKQGEKVIVALPPPAFLAFGSTKDLIFLPGPIERYRAQRFTLLSDDGRFVDFWTGVDTIVDTAGLCQMLISEPDLWLIVDESRLIGDWALAGPMAQVIEGMTYVRYSTEGGAMARGVSPPPSRDPLAESTCYAALTGRLVESDVTTEAEDTPTPSP